MMFGVGYRGDFGVGKVVEVIIYVFFIGFGKLGFIVVD